MADLRPRGAERLLACVRSRSCCLPCSKACRHTRRLISGLKCLMTLLPNFLRLTLRVTTASPRFAIGGVASPYRMGVPPIKRRTHSWAHLLFTALWTVIVTGFAIINRLRRWAKPISSHKLWPVIAQQVRDSAVNSNNKFSIISGNSYPAGSRSPLNSIHTEKASCVTRMLSSN